MPQSQANLTATFDSVTATTLFAAWSPSMSDTHLGPATVVPWALMAAGIGMASDSRYEMTVMDCSHYIITRVIMRFASRLLLILSLGTELQLNSTSQRWLST